MANITEVARSINAFGKTKGRSNPVGEFAWVLRNVRAKITNSA